MIRAKFLGHIRTTMGEETLDLASDRMTVDELFGHLLSKRPKAPQGFTKYNTLLVVNDDEVFSAASQSDRLLGDGDSVLLIPFSHGG